MKKSLLKESSGKEMQRSLEKLDVSIRSATCSDLAKIQDITRKAYSDPYKDNTLVTKPHEPEDLKEKLQNDKISILVAEINNQAVGAIRYKITEDNNLYFNKLVTLKPYRNQGVGELLINTVEDIAKNNGCHRVLLDCAQEKGLPDYYEKHGYQIDKIKKHHNHHDVFMSKDIEVSTKI